MTSQMYEIDVSKLEDLLGGYCSYEILNEFGVNRYNYPFYHPSSFYAKIDFENDGKNGLKFLKNKDDKKTIYDNKIWRR